MSNLWGSFAICGLRASKKIGPICFFAGHHKKQLNQAYHGFLFIGSSLFARATLIVFGYFVVFLLRLFFVLVWLSVPVQVIDWKDSSPKYNEDVIL